MGNSISSFLNQMKDHYLNAFEFDPRSLSAVNVACEKPASRPEEQAMNMEFGGNSQKTDQMLLHDCTISIRRC